jgi:hypothetical protein
MLWRVIVVIVLFATPTGVARAEEDVEALYGEAARESQELDRLKAVRAWMKTSNIGEGGNYETRAMRKDFQDAQRILTASEWAAVKPGTYVEVEMPAFVGRRPARRSTRNHPDGEVAGLHARIANLRATQAMVKGQIQDLEHSARAGRRAMAEQKPYVDAAVAKLKDILEQRKGELANAKLFGRRSPAQSRQSGTRMPDVQRTELQRLLNQIQRTESDIRMWNRQPEALDVRMPQLESASVAAPKTNGRVLQRPRRFWGPNNLDAHRSAEFHSMRRDSRIGGRVRLEHNPDHDAQRMKHHRTRATRMRAPR